MVPEKGYWYHELVSSPLQALQWGPKETGWKA